MLRTNRFSAAFAALLVSSAVSDVFRTLLHTAGLYKQLSQSASVRHTRELSPGDGTEAL